MKRARCWATRTSKRLRENLRPVLLRRTRDSVKLRAAAADDRDRPHHADRRAAGAARRPHADRRRHRPQEVPHRDGPACGCGWPCLMCRMSADSTFLVNKEPPGLLQQARPPGGAVRRAVRRRRPQGRAVLRMDDDARSDRAAAGQTEAAVRAAGRLGAAEEAAGAGPRVPEQRAIASCSSRPTPARRA